MAQHAKLCATEHLHGSSLKESYTRVLAEIEPLKDSLRGLWYPLPWHVTANYLMFANSPLLPFHVPLLFVSFNHIVSQPKEWQRTHSTT